MASEPSPCLGEHQDFIEEKQLNQHPNYNYIRKYHIRLNCLRIHLRTRKESGQSGHRDPSRFVTSLLFFDLKTNVGVECTGHIIIERASIRIRPR